MGRDIHGCYEWRNTGKRDPMHPEGDWIGDGELPFVRFRVLWDDWADGCRDEDATLPRPVRLHIEETTDLNCTPHDHRWNLSDVGRAVMADNEPPDGHSHGFYTLEALKWFRDKWCKEPLGPGFHNDRDGLDRYVEDMEAIRARRGITDKDVRMVFCFDN